MKNKNIRSKFVKDALVDSYNLARFIQENTQNIAKDFLSESIKNEFKNILDEAVDDEEDEDLPEISDVNDAQSQDSSNDAQGEENIENTDMDANSGGNDINADVTSDDAENSTVDDSGEGVSTEVDTASDASDDMADGDDEWGEFDDYKISDGEYDMTQAGKDNFVKVYKLLAPDDDVRIITKDNGNVEIKNDKTGEDYLISVGNDEDSASSEQGNAMGESCQEESMNENDQEQGNDMTDDTIYEVALKEYNSNVGYTDSYQKTDTMTNDGMKEPGKNVNDWDKGVPKGTEKPWGKGTKSAKPFEKKTKCCNEEEEDVVDDSVNEEDEANIEEANLSQSRWNDTHAVHNRVPAANKDEFRRKGIQKTSKGTKYRANGSSDQLAEQLTQLVSKANEILKENNVLKNNLRHFRTLVEQAAVTNANLGNTIKFFMNMPTTSEEKKVIANRFYNEPKTIKESKALFDKLMKEYEHKGNANLNESTLDKQYSANSSKNLNETKIVEDESLMKTLDLWNRMQRY